ncbi:epoxide hydrolase [Glaciihabitans arcticus]|uniref:Epoxide hydrolase n=1 Tax=Glaciihabitans arcticus TaxID=2668039 RepID=A0A4Q9GYN4_9MICO|nr:epoxide hydrolase family protein [Glaciihabitans arcticus]TBN58367.1 epoxide hydrolase [Glaciihabitans arcticus]
MSEPELFLIHVTDAELADLRQRLRATRFLPDSPRRPASGMTEAYLRQLVHSWLELDWREREAQLNAYPQFLAQVDGEFLHFVHRAADRSGAPTLLVMHGWPHTFALQLELVDRLPDFNLVVPSFPGFGFSPPYANGPISEDRLAHSMHVLMTETLGYASYFTYGEDVSANVNDLIAATWPEEVDGIIATHAHFGTSEERATYADPAATAFFERIAATHGPDGAYGHVQATRPDTLAAALGDSPAGLLAWLAEKLVEWSDTPPGDPSGVEKRIARERILTEAMIYWHTRSIATSFRPYYEGADTPGRTPPVEVPAAVFIQRHEHDYPESVARDFYRDLRVFERLDEGGHFTAAEVPDAMAGRIRDFANSLLRDSA